MTRIMQREKTAAEWTAANTVLLKGEVGWETGNPPKAKKGDGTTAWNALPYAIQPGAPLASPAFTGNPTAPTPVVSDNDTSIATTAFVKAALAALISGSPALLDTLDELAAALGDDPNFAATMATALALRAPIASPTFTGDPKAPTPAATDNDTSIATTAFVKAARPGKTYDVATGDVSPSSGTPVQVIPGLSRVITVVATTDVLLLTLELTVAFSGGTIWSVYPRVDGVDQPVAQYNMSTGTQPISRSWKITGLSVGAHTITVAARFDAGSTYTVGGGRTAMMIDRIVS